MKKRAKIAVRVRVQPQALQEEREFNQRLRLFLVEIVRQTMQSGRKPQ
jgi:hypothetical protein